MLLGRVGGGPDLGVRRLTADGRLDAGFGSGGLATVQPYTGTLAVSESVSAIAVQPDGQIVLAGSVGAAVSTGTGTDLQAIVAGRLTAAGRPDPSFGTGGGVVVNPSVGGFQMAFATTVAVLPDGRIAVGGGVYDHTALFNGKDRVPALDPTVIRLTAAGRFDTTFGDGGLAAVPTEANFVTSLVALPDGRLTLLAGQPSYTTTGGVIAARLTADGKLDPTYGTAGRVNGLASPPLGQPGVVTPGGRVVVYVDSPGGVSGEFRRLTADGQPDPTFGTDPLPSFKVFGDGPRLTGAADDGIVFLGSPAGVNSVIRVLGTANPFPYAVGTFTAGGSRDGKFTPVAPAAGGTLAADTAVAVYPNFTGGVRTATADITGDGVPDTVVGPGPGGGPNIIVYDGATGARLADLNAFETAFTGGVFVAAADLTGDGKADIVVTPDQGGGPVVVVYDGAGIAAGKNEAAQLVRFFGIEDAAFRGGARPAVGDFDGDGRPDLAVAAGTGGGPRVALFDGRSVAAPAAGGLPRKLVGDFFALEPAVRDGVFVAAGDLTGDGKADLVVGGGPGGGPRVTAFDGAALAAGNTQTQVANFFAGDSATRGGVRVAIRPAADGTPELVTGSGAGLPGRVQVYKPATARAGGPADQSFAPFGDGPLADGVFVG